MLTFLVLRPCSVRAVSYHYLPDPSDEPICDQATDLSSRLLKKEILVLGTLRWTHISLQLRRCIREDSV